MFFYRLDLFTAVIIGPVGTPFDSTPFVFDVWLPDNYPNEPPKVGLNHVCEHRKRKFFVY